MVLVKALIIRDGKILLAQRAKNDSGGLMWELPGGHMETGESAAETIIRELREELGVEATVESIVYQDLIDFPRRRVELIICKIASITGEITLSAHEQIEWVNPSDLDNYNTGRRLFGAFFQSINDHV